MRSPGNPVTVRRTEEEIQDHQSLLTAAGGALDLFVRMDQLKLYGPADQYTEGPADQYTEGHGGPVHRGPRRTSTQRATADQYTEGHGGPVHRGPRRTSTQRATADQYTEGPADQYTEGHGGPVHRGPGGPLH
ncbi:unnamed protein product [Boreogadus saida]